MKFSTKQLVLLVAAVLALFTFACMFMYPLQANSMGLGWTNLKAEDIFFSDHSVWPTMIGYFLSLAVAVALVIFTLFIKDKKMGKLVRLVCIGVMALVAVLCFSTAGFYSGLNGDIILTSLKLGVGSILGGASAILTAGLIGVAEFVLKD